MGGNFKIKYIGDGSNRYFTYNKIYEIKDGVLILDNGTRLTNIQNFSSICYNINATFEEIKEEGENKMESAKGNLKVKCLDVRGYNKYYTKGKVYEVIDGVFTYDDGDVIENITSFDDFNIRTSAMWELIEDSSDLRELIKPCMVVKMRNDKLWLVGLNREGICYNLNDDSSYGLYMKEYNKDLICRADMHQFDIMEIYGHMDYASDCNQLNVSNRLLIWKRTEISPTQLKLEELEKKQRAIADEMEKLRKEL